MANAELQIGLNIDASKRSFIELKNEAKKLEKSQINLFPKEQRQFLQTQAKKMLGDIGDKLKENERLVAKSSKEMSNLAKGTQEYATAERRVNDLLKERTRILSLQKEYQGVSKGIGPQRGINPQVLSQMPGTAGRAGGMLSRVGSLAGRLGPMGLAAGGILGLGGFAASRMMGAYGTFSQGIGNRVALRGLGMGDVDLSDRSRAARAGLDAQDMRSRRVAAGRVLGREGGSQEAVLRRAEFERNFGLESGMMAGLGGQLRGQMGGAGANEAVMKLQASVLAAGIEDALGPYLEAATSMLSQINENGLMGNDQMIQLLGQLAADGKNTPEQIARTFTTLQGAVVGSTGEQNAFFQQAFARAGIGGGTVGGTKLGIEAGGLFGLDQEELNRRFGGNLGGTLGQGLGFTQGFGKRGGAILDEVKQLAGVQGSVQDIKDPQQATFLSNFANRIFGTKGLEGLEATRMLEDALKDPEKAKDFQKRMEEMKKTPELKNLELIKKSSAGAVQYLEKIANSVQDELGANMSSTAIALKMMLVKFDMLLNSLVGTFATTGAEALAGEEGIGKGEFELATAGDPEQQRQFRDKLAKNYLENERRIQEISPKLQELRQGGGDPVERMKLESEMSERLGKRGSFLRSDQEIGGLNERLGEEGQRMVRQQRAEQEKGGFGRFMEDMLAPFTGQNRSGVDGSLNIVKAIQEQTTILKNQKPVKMDNKPQASPTDRTVED